MVQIIVLSFIFGFGAAVIGTYIYKYHYKEESWSESGKPDTGMWVWIMIIGFILFTLFFLIGRYFYLDEKSYKDWIKEHNKKRQENELIIEKRIEKEKVIKEQIKNYFKESESLLSKPFLEKKDMKVISKYYADTLQFFYTVQNISRDSVLQLSENYFNEVIKQKQHKQFYTNHIFSDSITIVPRQNNSYILVYYNPRRHVYIRVDSTLRIFSITDFYPPRFKKPNFIL